MTGSLAPTTHPTLVPVVVNVAIVTVVAETVAAATAGGTIAGENTRDTREMRSTVIHLILYMDPRLVNRHYRRNRRRRRPLVTSTWELPPP